MARIFRFSQPQTDRSARRFIGDARRDRLSDASGVVMTIACVLLSACGSSTTEPALSKVTTGTDTVSTGVLDANGDASIFTPDGAGAGTDGQTAADAGTTDALPGDTSSADAATEQKICESAGGFGCKCTANDECDTGYCVQGPQGRVCTKTCLGSCPAGFKCVQTGDSGDLTYLCSPTTTTLCQPCELDADCDHVGADKGSTACLPVQGADGSTIGSFCSAPCGGGVACPAGFDCKELDLADGKTSQCISKNNAACTCNGWGIDQKASTTCSKHNAAGTCWGVKACKADGLDLCTAATPTVEACNAADDDCDGSTDEGFSYDDGGTPKVLGEACGIGACVGGLVTCSADGTGATCTTLSNSASETCNYKDDNCDGQTDEGLGTTDSTCAQTGVCTATNVQATCAKGQWICDYNAVPGYEATTETTCDGQDNNCDGQADEAFQYASLSIGAPCEGVGACGKGVVVCAISQSGATCSTNADGSGSQATMELCDDIDNDCDGQTDEGCDDDGDGYCDATMTIVGTPAVCTKVGKDCNDDAKAVNPAAKDVCNDVDDDCDKTVDNGCDDDGDGYCDDTMVVVGKPKICPNGSGDCNDKDKAINPGVEEICDTKGVDENCNGKAEEPDAKLCKSYYFDGDGDGYGKQGSGAKCLCKADAAIKFTSLVVTDCDDAKKAVNPAAKETCATVYDDDCDKNTNDLNAIGCKKFYVDLDDDNFGDVKSPTKCLCASIQSEHYTTTKGGDCVDANKAINPSMKEDCATKYDDNCNKNINDVDAIGCKKFYLDGDGDGYGLLGSPATCTCTPNAAKKFTALKAGDCNDAKKTINPGVQEICDSKGIDENCNGKAEEPNAKLCKSYYFDGDADGYGKKGSALKCLCKADAKSKFTSKVVTDCDDTKKAVNPAAKETCATPYDDDCDKNTNDLNAIGCKKFYVDADDDNYGDVKSPTKCLCTSIPSQHYTTTKGGDCMDANKAINPGVKESCATAYDDNCNNNTNDVNALFCTQFYKDGDGDGYGLLNSQAACTCKANIALKYTALKTGDCDDTNKAIRPGVKDTCSTPGVDDNCDGKKDPEDSLNCTKYYYDKDSDGYGIGAPRCLCTADKGAKFIAKKPGDCNDSVGAIKPGAPELCNGLDDNCNNIKDEGATASCASVIHGAVACVSPACTITKCTAAYFDIDKSYSNGCECGADANYGGKGGSCKTPIIAATLVDTQKKRATYSGNLMPGEAGQWYRFYAQDSTDSGGCDNYDVRIRFTSNPGNVFQMDVYRGGCAGGQQICKDETEHRYRVDFYGATSGPWAKKGKVSGTKYKTPQPIKGGECKCTTKTGATGPGIPGWNACTNQSTYYYVRIHYKAGVAPVCSKFTVEFSNGYY